MVECSFDIMKCDAHYTLFLVVVGVWTTHKNPQVFVEIKGSLKNFQEICLLNYFG